MLDGIDVAVRDMPLVVDVVTNKVFPKSALPDAAFMASETDGTEELLLRELPHEAALDQAPACREIPIIIGQQSQDRMKRIGQHDKGLDREWEIEPCRRDRLA